MNRKLRNTLTAFSATGATLAVALMMAMPSGVPPMLDVASAEALGANVLSAEIAVASNLAAQAAQVEQAKHDPRVSRKGTRHRRRTLVMPYFSFTPRG